MVGVSDMTGGLRDSAGIDREELDLALALASGLPLAEAGTGEPVGREAVLELDCDVLVLASVVPDLIANGGGVIASHAESKSDRGVTPVPGAIAVSRVIEAHRVRGLCP